MMIFTNYTSSSQSLSECIENSNVQLTKSLCEVKISDSQVKQKSKRNSNLELYRIIVMLLIVAHHYVVNSGLIDTIREAPMTLQSCLMLIFGAWGKTGINCFVFITGWFMCKSEISAKKLIKLYLQVIFYAFIIYAIFLMTGYEKLSLVRFISCFALRDMSTDFVSCFLIFYLFIPFLNILIDKVTKKQLKYLVLLLLVTHCLLPSIPKFFILTFNYVSWFICIYFVAAYARLYGGNWKIIHKRWGLITLILLVISSFSVVGMEAIYKYGLYTAVYAPYYFLVDSNKLLPLAIGFTSFMYFKDLKIPYLRLINIIGATTFGVLLIHANSDAMRRWLWRETVDCVGHYGGDILLTISYAIVSVLVIFIICSGIEWFRSKFIEQHIISIVEKSMNKWKLAINKLKL